MPGPDAGLQYIGPDPQMPGGHLIQTPDGGIITMPADGLTPALQNQAIQATIDPNGGFNGGQSAPPPQQDPRTTPSQAQRDFLAQAGQPYDSGNQAVPNAAQLQTLNGGNAPAMSPGQLGMVPQPKSTAGTPAAVPIPSNLSFQPPAPSQAPIQPPAPTQGGQGGGGPPAGTQAAAKVFGQEAQSEQQAAQTQKDYETNLANSQFRVGQQYSDQQAALLAQRQAHDAAIQQHVAELLQKSQDIGKQFINAKVDPQSYWGNMSTGDHIQAGLSMILSGLGAGLSGQQNLAVKHFEDAQNNDIAAQRYNIEHGKQASEMYSTLAKEYQSAGLSQRQALDATDLAIKAKNQTDASNQALAFGGQEAQAKYLKETAPLQAKLLSDTQGFAKNVAETKLQQAQAAAQYADAAQKRAEAATMPMKYQQAQLANQVQGPDGSLGYAPSPEAVKDFNSEAKPAQDISMILDRIDEARKAGVVPNQSELQGLAGRLRQSVAEIGGEKESARTEEIIKAMTGDPTQYFSVLPQSSWSNREKALRGISFDTLNAAGKRHSIQWRVKPPSSIKATPVG
jgi:hypothetical protein